MGVAKYLVVYPLLFIIDVIDFCIGCCKSRNKYKGFPSKPPYSIQVDKSDPSSPYRSIMTKELFKFSENNSNIYFEFKEAVKKFSQVKTLGVREILSTENQVQENGKVFKKFNMRNFYKWSNYEEVLSRVDSISNGLLKLGIKSNDNIIFFSETRPEWITTAFSCFKIKVPIVTLYATLGIEALVYGIDQTEASVLIASSESVLKIEKIKDRMPRIKFVIVFDDKYNAENVVKLKNSARNIQVYTLDEIINIGKESPVISNYESPKKDDLAIIMYTSGSTGNPKGVMMTHGNILTSLKSIFPRAGSLKSSDAYIGYLPIAHVFELMVEIGMLIHGVAIGFSSPYTLTDASTAIKEGDMGDLRVLKPTVISCVPTVLERLNKGVKDKLSKESDLKKTLIDLAMKKKLKKLHSRKSTVMLDKLVFNKINELVVGGRLRLILSGGALLNKDVHEFSQTCLGQVIQIYGLTETCGGGSSLLFFEPDTEQVGSIVSCCEVKLVDWLEGNYKCTDKPNPRGEIWIGGDNITMGYYKMPDKTKEDFRIINGVKYFATGDIGEMLPNGNLKIIDRKKDLVKLQGGEYVSLNKIESVIKLLQFVDNCCVIANPAKSNCICLISPNVKKIKELLSSSEILDETKQSPANLERRRSIEILEDFISILEKNKNLNEKYTKTVFDHCKQHNLETFEIPTKVKFVKETWLPDSGLVTDSLKLKRKEIETFYKKEIDQLYA